MRSAVEEDTADPRMASNETSIEKRYDTRPERCPTAWLALGL